jgi:hypothetical protein
LPLRCVCVVLYAESADVWSIHREAPEFTEQSTEQEILATGIKVRCMHNACCVAVTAVNAYMQKCDGYGASPLRQIVHLVRPFACIVIGQLGDKQTLLTPDQMLKQGQRLQHAVLHVW